MILRKPYAFFIKYFKIIHIFMALIILYLIYNTNSIIVFFTNYLSSKSSVVGQDLTRILFSKLLFIIPIIVVLVSLLILGIMFKKQKPYKFYIITIFTFIVVLVSFFYCYSFLNKMENSIMNIKTIKLTHDLLIITIFLETISFIVFFARGFGLNFKKFDFSSDLVKLNVDERDNEEFELEVSVDLNEKKRFLKRKIRFLGYSLKEHKAILITLLILTFSAIGIFLYSTIFVTKKINYEGSNIIIDGINFSVNKSYLLKQNDKYLLINEINLSSSISNSNIYLKDLNLKIGEYKFTNTKKYCNSLVDLGNCYSGNTLSSNLDTYLVVYEIPEMYINSDMIIEYTTMNDKIKIKINPIQLTGKKKEHIYNLNDQLTFEDNILKNISFTVNSYEINQTFKIDYKFCVSENDCLDSFEYLTPKINTTFDKIILKINVDYSNTNKKTSFYDLFNRYGSISYTINGENYIQSSSFEKIESKRTLGKKDIYIGVNSDIINANTINLVFNLRNNKYIYKLKGE